MVSVIIPSIRPRNLQIIVDKFMKSQQGADFEFIVITNFPPYYRGTMNWIPDYEKKGCINAIHRGFLEARGEYIFLLNDMAELSQGGLKIMEAFSRMNGDNIIVNQHTVPTTKLEYYGITFAPYPFVHRSVIDKIGGFFDPTYKAFYADPDFSLRAYEANIPIVKLPTVIVTRNSPRRFLGLRLNYAGHQDNINKYFEKDRETFIERWKHLGEFHEPS